MQCIAAQIFRGLDHLDAQLLAVAAVVLKGLPLLVAEAVVIAGYQR